MLFGDRGLSSFKTDTLHGTLCYFGETGRPLGILHALDSIPDNLTNKSVSLKRPNAATADRPRHEDAPLCRAPYLIVPLRSTGTTMLSSGQPAILPMPFSRRVESMSWHYSQPYSRLQSEFSQVVKICSHDHSASKNFHYDQLSTSVICGYFLFESRHGIKGGVTLLLHLGL